MVAVGESDDAKMGLGLFVRLLVATGRWYMMLYVGHLVCVLLCAAQAKETPRSITKQPS